ncbi:uncharacterized protein LOC135373906 isoform X2 [Ornithodoros turicata]|uniref:uncharacterized protein LOC135373906 isoform X2 n=1 Tax=Ornithodoros turicata TaxID=34597 RepID=UPI0031399A24
MEITTMLLPLPVQRKTGCGRGCGLKDRAWEEPHLPAPDIYEQELVSLDRAHVGDDVLQSLSSYNTIQGIIYREKRRNQPPLPQTAADLQLSGHYSETVNGRRFLLFSEENNGQCTLCFSTEEHLLLLAESHEVFVNGTFFTCPHIFGQILTISVDKDGKHLIVAFFLMPGRSRDIYERAFQRLLQEMQDQDLALSLDLTRSDFEQALIGALQAVFMSARHRGCHFHYGQAVWRNVQACGLAATYTQNENLRVFVRKTVSLAFVRMAWGLLKATAPQVLGMGAFVAYFQNTWMDGQYPPPIWNQHGNRGARTNNATESWHRKLKRVVGKPHPNIYTCLEALRCIESAQCVGLLQAANGATQRQRKKKWQKKGAAIPRLEEKLQAGEIMMDAFLRKGQRHCGL